MSKPEPLTADLREAVIEVIRTIYDPEIPVNIYDMGLIYAIDIDEERNVNVTMTLTSPMCPVAESLPLEVEMSLNRLPEVETTNIDLVWDPPWDPSQMSEAARLELGM